MHKKGLHSIRPEYLPPLFVSLTTSCARVNDFIMETRGWYFKWIVTSASEVDYISRTNHSTSRGDIFADGLLKKSTISSHEIRDVTIIPEQTINSTNVPIYWQCKYLNTIINVTIYSMYVLILNAHVEYSLFAWNSFHILHICLFFLLHKFCENF